MSGRREIARGLARTLRARSVYQPAKRVVRRTGPEAPAAPAERVGGGDAGALSWDSLREGALGCRKCGLCATRTTVVVGDGDPRARLMFVGEAPGRDEDLQGLPFVGRAGQLLTQMIEGMGLRRDQVYIANVLKCRPPENRPPLPDEVAACRPWLDAQIALIDPKVICALGAHAMRALLGEGVPGITQSRGRVFEGPGGRATVPTYHPAYLLRNPAAKREAWDDLKKILSLLGLPVPPPKKPSR